MGSLSTSLQAICHVSYNLVSDKDLSHSDRYWHSVLLLRGIPFDASFGQHAAVNCFPILDCLSTRVVCERLCAMQYARGECTLSRVFRSIQRKCVNWRRSNSGALSSQRVVGGGVLRVADRLGRCIMHTLVCFCEYVYQYLSLYVDVSIFLSDCLSVCLSMCLLGCLSDCVPVCGI